MKTSKEESSSARAESRASLKMDQFVTSTARNMARIPYFAENCSVSRANNSFDRAMKTKSNPFLANTSHIPTPIPFDAQVTHATLLWVLIFFIFLFIYFFIYFLFIFYLF